MKDKKRLPRFTAWPPHPVMLLSHLEDTVPYWAQPSLTLAVLRACPSLSLDMRGCSLAGSSAGAATRCSCPCLCLRCGKAQSPGLSESTPVQPRPALQPAGIPPLSCSQDAPPCPRGDQSLSLLGDSRGEDGALPCASHMPHSLHRWAWRGGKQVRLGPIVRPSLSPETSSVPRVPLGQTPYQLLHGSCTQFHPCTCGVIPLSPLLR